MYEIISLYGRPFHELCDRRERLQVISLKRVAKALLIFGPLTVAGLVGWSVYGNVLLKVLAALVAMVVQKGNISLPIH